MSSDDLVLWDSLANAFMTIEAGIDAADYIKARLY